MHIIGNVPITLVTFFFTFHFRYNILKQWLEYAWTQTVWVLILALLLLAVLPCKTSFDSLFLSDFLNVNVKF